MATPAPGSHPAAHEAATQQTVTYRGPTVLMGAFAHLLREEGLEFERPSDDRRGTEAAVEVVMSVSAVDPTGRTLDERIDAAVTSFRRRFGDDSSSVEVGPRDDVG